jgi:hypothetical protein
LSDTQWQTLKRFVESGGGLVATGKTGTRDDWRRVRTKNALTELFGLELGPKIVRKTFGKGRVAYIPELVPGTKYEDNPLRHPYGDHEDCVPPKNWKQIEEVLRWAAGGRFGFEVKAPKGVACEFRQGPKPGDRVVHLINFTGKPVKGSIAITMAGNADEQWRLRLLSLDGAPKKMPLLKKSTTGVSLTLAGMGSLYTACVFQNK